jgi:hypothetical protein
MIRISKSLVEIRTIADKWIEMFKNAMRNTVEPVGALQRG